MLKPKAEIRAEITIPGITARAIEYSWNAGNEMIIKPPAANLLRRTSPLAAPIDAFYGDQTQRMGTLCFFPQDQELPVYVAGDYKRISVVKCDFGSTWLKRLSSLSAGWADHDWRRYIDVRNSRLDRAMQWLEDELFAPGFAGETVLEGVASALTVEMSRYFSEPLPKMRIRTRMGKLSPADLRWIVDYLHAVDNRCPTVDELAQGCGISATHLRRAVKNTTGHSIHQFICKVRAEKARYMLNATDLPLKQIAFRLGFASPNAFIFAFRKEQGETPNAYRQRVRNG